MSNLNLEQAKKYAYLMQQSYNDTGGNPEAG
jgi:hypothetical protein